MNPEKPLIPAHITGSVPPLEREVLLGVSAERVKIEVYSSAELSEISEAEINAAAVPSENPEESGSVRRLRQAVDILHGTWKALHETGKAIEEPSRLAVARNLSQPGAHLVILRAPLALDGTGSGSAPQILGCGVIYTDKNFFPDRHDIPQALLDQGDICRAGGLFVTDLGRQYFPSGEAVDVIDQVRENIAAERIILGKVLVPSEGETLEQSMQGGRRAHARRGWEYTGFISQELYKKKDGTQALRKFEWWQFPAGSEAANKSLAEHEHSKAELQEWVRTRLAWCLANFAAAGETLLVASADRYDALYLARLYPGNQILSLDLQTGDSRRKAPGAWPNLITATSDQLSQLPDALANVTGIYLTSVLPDIARACPAGESPKQHALEWLKAELTSIHQRESTKSIVRDTVAPDWPESVVITLSTTDGKDSGEPEQLSTAGLFRHFTGKLRQMDLLYGAEISEPVDDVNAGTRSFILPGWLAAEFMLNRPYFKDWDHELPRRKTHLDIKDRRAVAKELGLREVYAGPELTSWIQEKYWNGHITITNLTGKELSYPPTNYVTVFEKVADGTGVELVETSCTIGQPTKFVEVSTYAPPDSTRDEDQIEVARRPGETLDVVPYFIDPSGRLYVGIKRDYPRPLSRLSEPSFFGAKTSGYVTEQLAAIVLSGTLDSDEGIRSAATTILAERANMDANLIEAFGPKLDYYPSPDLVDERVLVRFVRVSPQFKPNSPSQNYSSFSTSGRVQMVDARMLLEACRIGSLPNARLAVAVHHLFAHLNQPTGVKGDRFDLQPQQNRSFKASSIDELLALPKELRFQELPDTPPRFLQTHSGIYKERSSSGEYLASVTLESVIPDSATGLGLNQLAIAPLVHVLLSDGTEEIYIGLEERHLPTPQIHEENSRIFCVPHFKMPATLEPHQLKEYASARIADTFGISTLKIRATADYTPSIGITPVRIIPCLAEVDLVTAVKSDLHWLPLRKLTEPRAAALLKHGATRVLVYRAMGA